MRREYPTILAEVLAEFAEATAQGETRMTQIAAKCNLPYGRFRELTRRLQARGLLSGDAAPQLTETGREFLGRYLAWSEVLRQYRLDSTAGTDE